MYAICNTPEIWYDVSDYLCGTKGIGMPQTYDLAPLDNDAQRVTQRIIYAGGVLTLPSLFLALSGLLRYDAFYVSAIVCCVLAGVVLCYIGWMWVRQARAIELRETQLVIKRRIGRTIIVPLQHIEE